MTIKFEVGDCFPFKDHKDRIQRYQENMLLYKGKHYDLFRKYSINPNHNLYVSINLASLIAKKSADLLLGEVVQVSAGKRENSPEQKAFDRLIESNHMNIVNYESALTNAIKGDAFYKIRYGQEYGGMLPPELDEPRVIIENINADHVFPETSKWDKHRIEKYHICIPVYDEDSDKWMLMVETHTAGVIYYHNYDLKVTRTDIFGTPEEWTLGHPISEMVQVHTGVNLPLVVHIPNTATDSWEGMDDLSEHKSIFDEINNRLTQIASILDKHSDPALAVPSGLLAEDNEGRPMFRVARDKVFEVMGKDDIIPQYITWNSQLSEAYNEIDRLVDLLLMSAEIPKVALGAGDSGTSGSSGLAIKFRMHSLLSKINRKRQYYSKGLKQVFYIAQLLEKALGIADYELTAPVLDFKDGLPKDDLQEANIMAIRTGGVATLSQKSALMYLDNLTEEQAEAEIERIREEQKANAPAMADPSIFNLDAEEELDPDIEQNHEESQLESQVVSNE